MRTFALQLKPRAGSPPETAHAWFLPVTEPRAWLDEAIACGAPLESLRLHLIPTNAHDLTPAAALLTAPIEFAAGGSGVAIPCARLGNDKLIYPHGTALSPPVTAAELERTLPSAHYFLHPTLGLTAFDPESALSALDLLVPPAADASDWSQAHPGNPAIPRLSSVELTLSESLEDILGSGKEDIGTRTQEDLPKKPGEKKEGLLGEGVGGAASAAGKLAAGGLFKGILKLTGKAPNTADKRTWIDFLHDWAEKKMDGLNFRTQQEKEIERLMHLLETNPDEGLKYALPLNSDNARGAGDLSGHLNRHNTDFSLRNLGGGQSYSPWDIDWEAQQKLTQQYREAANRELRLGRHRRAAYIFAELLNDKAAAADALKQGEHYHEAAILYRDHLKRPLEAAWCFRRAGMIHHAIAMYELEEKFELLGDLYRELEMEQEATAAYRCEVVRLLEQQRDPLPAAKLLEGKLFAPEEALAALQSAWASTNNSKATSCLREEFALLQRLARPEAADTRIAEVTKDTIFPRVIPLVTLLSELANYYFNPATRELAKDSARVLAGSNLKKFSTTEQRTILEAVQRTEEADLLLGRDARRYTEQQEKRWPRANTAKPKPRSSMSPLGGSEQFLLVGSEALDNSLLWHTAIARSGGFYMAGRNLDSLVLDSYSWGSRKWARALWENPRSIGRTLHLIPEDRRASTVRVFSYNRFLAPSKFDTGDDTTATAPGSELGFAEGRPNWTIEIADSDIAIYARDPFSNEIRSTHYLSLLPPGLDKAQLIREIGFIPMIARKLQVYFAIGPHVGRLYNDRVDWMLLDSPVLDLHASNEHTKVRLVATHEQGASVFWGDSEWGLAEPIGLDMLNPVASFTRSGRLILASQGAFRSFVVRDGQVGDRSDGSLPDDETPIGIIDEDLRNFHIITPSHRHHYRLQKP